MPLLNGQPYQPSLALPEGIKPSDEVFHIRLTGEVLKDYEEYLKQAKLYRTKQWTCSETGRSQQARPATANGAPSARAQPVPAPAQAPPTSPTPRRWRPRSTRSHPGARQVALAPDGAQEAPRGQRGHVCVAPISCSPMGEAAGAAGTSLTPGRPARSLSWLG